MFTLWILLLIFGSIWNIKSEWTSFLLPLITLSRDRMQAGLLRTQTTDAPFHGAWSVVSGLVCVVIQYTYMRRKWSSSEHTWLWLVDTIGFFFMLLKHDINAQLRTERINYVLDNKSTYGTIVKFMCNLFTCPLYQCAFDAEFEVSTLCFPFVFCTWPHMHCIVW